MPYYSSMLISGRWGHPTPPMRTSRIARGFHPKRRKAGA